MSGGEWEVENDAAVSCRDKVQHVTEITELSAVHHTQTTTQES